MTAYNFGAGTIIANRLDLANAKPAFFGTLQNFELTIDQKIEELIGQYKSPVAIAAAQQSIKWKSKIARIQAATYNNLLIGGVETSGAGFDLAVAEAHSIPTTPYEVTVTNSATWTQDEGVFVAATGKQLQPVASSPITGQYSVAAGVYTFAAADTGEAVLIYYKYTVTTYEQIAWANSLMGTQPTFQLNVSEKFTYFNTVCTLNLQLNYCIAGKLSFPFMNTKFTITDLEGECAADAANNIGYIVVSE